MISHLVKYQSVEYFCEDDVLIYRVKNFNFFFFKSPILKETKNNKYTTKNFFLYELKIKIKFLLI